MGWRATKRSATTQKAVLYRTPPLALLLLRWLEWCNVGRRWWAIWHSIMTRDIKCHRKRNLPIMIWIICDCHQLTNIYQLPTFNSVPYSNSDDGDDRVIANAWLPHYPIMYHVPKSHICDQNMSCQVCTYLEKREKMKFINQILILKILDGSSFEWETTISGEISL